MYRCSLCGKEYKELDDMLRCTKDCADKEREKQSGVKRDLEELKASKLKYHTLLSNFKKNHPKEYSEYMNCKVDFSKVSPNTMNLEDFIDKLFR